MGMRDGTIHESLKDCYYVIAKMNDDGTMLYLALQAANEAGTAFKPEWGKSIPERSMYNRFAFQDKDDAYLALGQRRYNVIENREWSYADEGAFVIQVNVWSLVRKVKQVE